MSDINGQVVEHCRVAEYEHVPQGDVALQRIELVLANGSVFTFRCASDGQSLAVDNVEITPIDLGEYGRIAIRGDHEICEVLAPGSIIESSVPLIDHDGIEIGIRLATGSGDAVHIYNWGDDLYALHDLPDTVKNNLI